MGRLIYIFVIIFTIGCTRTTTRTRPETNIHVGYEGLEMSFVKDAPPTEVYDRDYPFGVNVRFENVGEYDIPANKIKLQITGIDPSDFGGVQLTNTNDEELRGASIDPQGNAIEGGIANIDFSGLQASEITGKVEFNIRAKACYPYGTTTVSQICILEDLLGTTRKSGETPFCDPNANKDFENSGAPVQITNFRQSVTGKDKLSFTFDISHVGEGRVYELNSECNPSLDKKDKVHVKVDTGLSNLECSGLEGKTEGNVVLYGTGQAEKRSVVCTQVVPATRTDNEKQVRIELTYDYQQSITQPLVVTHITT